MKKQQNNFSQIIKEFEMVTNFYVEDTGSTFTPVPTGMHLARCYRIIDLGTQKTEYEGNIDYKRKLKLVWEIHGEDDAGGGCVSWHRRFSGQAGRRPNSEGSTSIATPHRCMPRSGKAPRAPSRPRTSAPVRPSRDRRSYRTAFSR